MQTIYMDGQCQNILPASGFKWENDLSKFTENFIKNYDEG